MKTFIKTLKYTTKESSDPYTYTNQLLTQSVDPQSTAQACLCPNENIILHSPLKRVSETIAAVSKKQQIISCNQLREIPFTIHPYCTKDEYLQKGSMVVRNIFIEKFITNTLSLDRISIEKEVREIESMIQKHNDVAIISHSFRLTILEAYFKTKGEIFKRPEKIKDYIQPEKKRYDFGSIAFTLQ